MQSLSGDKGAAVRMVGNACHITVRCIMCIWLATAKADLGSVVQATAAKKIPTGGHI